MLVVTKNSVYFISGTVREMKLGQKPVRVKWGGIDTTNGTINLREGELVQLETGNSLIVSYVDPAIISGDKQRQLITSVVEKTIFP